MPKISVIIPVYNVEKYLRECLTSVVNQTFKDIEIICINDGSTDSSPAILEEFAQKDTRIRIINQENQGLSCARNAGLEIATGEYISFVDSDDYISLKAYDKIITILYKYNPDLICFGTNIVGESFSYKRESDNKYYKVNFSGYYKADFDKLAKTDVAAWNKIYKASIIKKHAILFPPNLHYEDFAFTYKYFACCKFVYYEPEKLYNYVRRDDSIMAQTFTNNSTKILDHLIVFKDVFSFYKQNNLYIDNINNIEKAFLYCFDFTIHFSSRENYTNIINKGKKILIDTNIKFKNPRINAILNNDINKAIDKRTLSQKIFSLKNFEQGGYKNKILTILGIQFKIASKPVWTHKPKVLVHLHLYYLEQIDYMLKKLKNINSCDWDLFVTMTQKDEKCINKIKKLKPDAKIIFVEDKGFDIWPFLQVLNLVDLNDYDNILKIHTKKYRNKKDFYGKGYDWRNYLVDALLQTPKRFQTNIHLMQTDNTIGLIGSNVTLGTMGDREADDGILFDEMCKKHNIEPTKGNFIAGTMFLAKAKCFQAIKDMNFQAEDFNHIQQTSGRMTTAHTLERLLSRIVEIEGYKITTVPSLKYKLHFVNKKLFEFIFSIKSLQQQNNQPKTKIITILGFKFYKRAK